ncbi:peptide deformylase 2-like [Macrosteles quadrilineatus]|uniref:peptide deformylase 2-like n=1 Tax=Macrosteles quadrilineatus TaxID=74068 RepID=UPI0023E2B226|nr:peptide deformylase 2-like [Macrosteles quadrilineatus]
MANQEDDSEGGIVPNFIYEDLQDLSENKETPLRKVAEKFQFPLTMNDFKDLGLLGLRFEKMEDAYGLSLPQIGINKRAFIFEVRHPVEGDQSEPKSEHSQPLADDIDPMGEVDLKKIMEQKEPGEIWPKTLWINPTYTIPRDAVLDEGYEVCYSLKCKDDLVIGPVFRLNRINYRAYDAEGRIYEGQVEGEVARVIQHEIDHLDGKLFIDYVQPERVMQLPDYIEKKGNGQLQPLEKGVVPQFSN